LASNPSAIAFADGFPLSDGHALVIPRHHVERLEDLDDTAWADVFAIVRQLARELATDGVNIGVNSGAAAGQTIAHAHVHVIPRSVGDIEHPRGGVRWVLPRMADYWTDR
jgi:diadenosine tetraphosphate (Ap4A) HIT family hydrolase